MLSGTFLSWLDGHSGAITAIATVVLVAITGVYVVVTYLLVMEQRNQADHPAVDFLLADVEPPDVNIRLRNVGTGAAAELTMLAGPGEGVAVVTSPAFGQRTTLLAGDSCTWKLRPPGADGLEPGLLPLTMSYFDNPRSKVFYEVMLLEVKAAADGEGKLVNLGSVQVISSRSRVRRNTRRSLSLWKRPAFHVRTRGKELSELLLDEDVCEYVHDSLTKVMGELRQLRPRMQAVRSKV